MNSNKYRNTLITMFNNNCLRSCFFVALLASSFKIHAQQEISLDEAISLAKQYNHQLKSENLIVAYQEAMSKTAVDINPTDVNTEFGQFNSTYFDTKIGVSQAFSLPQVYKNRKKYLTEEVKSAVLGISISEREIKQNLDMIFLQYAYFKAKEQILNQHDSLYQAFLNKTVARQKVGETDILETTLAEQQRYNISIQLRKVRSELEILILELNLLVNAPVSYLPKETSFGVLKTNLLTDSLSLQNHPKLRLADQKVAVANAMTRMREAALLPSFSVGYNNFSIRGTGADNQVYQAKDRFSSVQIGMSIPIVRKSLKANIDASKIQESIYANQRNREFATLNNYRLQQNKKYWQLASQIEYFEKIGLKNALIFRQTASVQYQNGQINYLEFVMLLNQSIGIENDYIDATKAINEVIISLNYLTSNF